MSSIEGTIEQAFNTQLQAVATSQSVAVAWPNLPFTPVANKGYLKPALLTGRTLQIVLGARGENRHAGIYQVSVFWPENKATIPARDLAGVVMEAFKLGTQLTQDGLIVRVNAPPWPDAALQETGWYQVPVSIPYLVDALNGELP